MTCTITRSYATQRKAFDKPISSLYAIQEKLAEMSVKIDASRYHQQFFITILLYFTLLCSTVPYPTLPYLTLPYPTIIFT